MYNCFFFFGGVFFYCAHYKKYDFDFMFHVTTSYEVVLGLPLILSEKDLVCILSLTES